MARRENAHHRAAFEEWYRVERDFLKAHEILLTKPDYKAPKAVQTLYEWAEAYNWHARADKRDDAAEEKAAKEAIKRKAAMLKRHADTGRSLQGIGLQFLQKQGVDSGQQAINAITKGIEVERTSEGLPAWIVDLLAASDDELAARYNELLTRIGGDRSGDETSGDSDTRLAHDTDSAT